MEFSQKVGNPNLFGLPLPTLASPKEGKKGSRGISSTS